MTLGAMIVELTDEARGIEALVATCDIALMLRVQSAAADAKLPVHELIGDLVGWFNAAAAPDDWVHVMAVANRSATPGVACLGAMLSVALKHRESHHVLDHVGLRRD